MHTSNTSYLIDFSVITSLVLLINVASLSHDYLFNLYWSSGKFKLYIYIYFFNKNQVRPLLIKLVVLYITHFITVNSYFFINI